MRLIDADNLIEFIDCGHLRSPTEKCFSELDIVNLLKQCREVDAVPVVRCKDCKYHDKNYRCKNKHNMTNIFDCYGDLMRGYISTEDNNYCSYGVQKDGENNGL